MADVSLSIEDTDEDEEDKEDEEEEEDAQNEGNEGGPGCRLVCYGVNLQTIILSWKKGREMGRGKSVVEF